MAIIFGSARLGENGKTTGGAAGDQTGKEVATQAMYTHKLGWYIFRPKSTTVATKLAEAMSIACANDNIGYDQNQRLGIITNGVNSKVKTEADCSSTVRACCIYAGFDPGNFTTGNEAVILEASKQFQKKIAYVSQAKTPVYDGDILVTKTKGHTGIIVSGNPRLSFSYAGVNYLPVFNYIFYANKYEDLNKAYGLDPAKLFTHFTTYGMKEGRQASAEFDVHYYKAHNADLQKAFGSDLRLYFKHYCEFGKSEGRRGC